MIDVENLTKIYGNTRSLDGLSFHVPEGEVLGLLGPNGAGKTTTMRVLTGLTRPDSGKARVAGFDTAGQHARIRALLGYLPEDSPVYPEMRVERYLRFMAGLKDIPPRRIAAEVDRVLGEVDLLPVRKRLIGNLSKGNRQRVGLAQALLGDPRILILDEPTVGLDPNQISEIRDLIGAMRGKRTVILSTHILPNVVKTCSRVVIIHEGRTVAEGPVDEIGKTLGGRRLQVRAKCPAAKLKEIVSGLAEVSGIKVESAERDGIASVSLPAPDSELRPALARAIVEAGIGLLEITESQPTLEDVFLRATATTRGLEE